MGRPRADASSPDTALRILDTAERLAQTAGFNGFSYADIARELALTKASLHYHFASKADLGRALMARYARNFAAALERIDAQGGSAPRRLGRYVELYAAVLRGDRMCLCGMLAAEHATLPEGLQGDVARFFADNEEWLARLLAAGRREGTLRFRGAPRDAARLVVGSLEGAMLLARSSGRTAAFDSVSGQLLASFAPVRETPRGSRRAAAAR
jgi:TetR/AcrR family transcriptional repressor of nem operon